MTLIAGHLFDSTDRCTLPIRESDGHEHACGRRWVDLMHCDHTYVDAEGYAHIGRLNLAEVGQIAAERHRRGRLLELATGFAAGGVAHEAAEHQPDVLGCFGEASPQGLWQLPSLAEIRERMLTTLRATMGDYIVDDPSLCAYVEMMAEATLEMHVELQWLFDVFKNGQAEDETSP